MKHARQLSPKNSTFALVRTHEEPIEGRVLLGSTISGWWVFSCSVGEKRSLVGLVDQLLHQAPNQVACHAVVLRLVTRGEERVTSLRTSAWEPLQTWPQLFKAPITLSIG